jgi:lysophospholipase L1-like esterase
VVLACLVLSGCSSPPKMHAATPNSLTYLALGDSYTIGQGVGEGEPWPVQLVTRLREQGIDIAEPIIIARTGWTTRDLLASIELQYDGEVYELVSLLIGVNNQYQGLAIEEYGQEFRKLLAFAISAAGGNPKRVIVLSIPDWSYTPFAEGRNRAGISAAIDTFNLVNRTESLAAGVHYFDITPSTRPDPYDANLIAGDGLHPSREMYELWVDQVFPAVLELLK